MSLLRRVMFLVWLIPLVGMANAEPLGLTLKLDIAAQPIGDALNEFARQSGLQVVIDPAESKGITASSVVGTFTPQAALVKLLSNTGLRFEYLNERTIAIRAPKSKLEASTSASPLSSDSKGAASGELKLARSDSTLSSPAAATGVQRADEESEQAYLDKQGKDEIIVRGRQEKLSTMKGDAPILETPQNIQVLSRELLKDMGAVLLEDGLRNVAGVMPGGVFPGYDYFRIRGFGSNASYLDGLRITPNYVGFNVELFDLERVEVVKGPASTLYGPLFSGMVNLVSKRPKPESFLDIGMTAGTQSFFEPTLDFGGSLNKNRTVYGRMVALYRRDGGFVDFADGLKRYYVAPSLTWEASPASKLTLFSVFNRDVNELPGYLPASGTVLPNPNGKIPLTRFVGNGLDPSPWTLESKSIGYQLTHEFSPTLAFRQNARASWFSSRYYNDLVPFFVDADQRTLYRYAASSTGGGWRVYGVDTGLDAQFATGRLQHFLTAGVDFTKTTRGTTGGYSDFSDLTVIPPLDLFNPVYGPIPQVPINLSPFSASTRTVGFYLNDRIKPTERLTLTVGGRFERSTGGNTYVSSASGTAFVPNVGLSYEFIPGLVGYANYSEAFEPQYTTRLVGNKFPDPLRGESWEGGIKTALFNERVNTTFAVFNLVRSNVEADDPLNPGFSILLGKQRSRGAEIDSQILLAPGWQMVASYSYVDTEILASDFIPTGTPLINVPKNSGSLWMKYTIQGGALDGLGFSLGGSTYSTQPADNLHTYNLPGYTLVNANVAYRKGNFSAQLNLNNALDEVYYSGSLGNIVLPGKFRSVRMSLGWSY